MNSKKKLLRKSQLYLITDENINAAFDAIKAGAEIIQLRIKERSDKFFLSKALHLRKITQKFKVPLIINDRVDIALICNADGVHLGQNDLSVNKTRKLLGTKRIIGVSTHSIKEAKQAIKSGADYIGIGPAFSSYTKTDHTPLSIDLIKKITELVSIPYFIIGGITLENLSKLLNYNIKKIAVSSSIIKSKNPYLQTKKLIEKLGH